MSDQNINIDIYILQQVFYMYEFVYGEIYKRFYQCIAYVFEMGLFTKSLP